MRVPIGVLLFEGRVWGRIQGGGGGGFLRKMREKGEGCWEGVGVGTVKGTGKSMRKLCRNYPLANDPLSGKKNEPKPKLFGPDVGWVSSM